MKRLGAPFRALAPVAIVAAALLATSAASADEVTIQPGSSITLTPGATTTVRCEGEQSTVAERFCACIEGFDPRIGSNQYVLKRIYVMSNGLVNEVRLGSYGFESVCREAMADTPVCAQ